MSSISSKQIRTDHKDLIQDIAFDFYGKRVATASLDQSVRIWNINENNEWVFKEELRISPGLQKVAWAHPEFGSLLAVAFDRLVWIYEETCFGTGRCTQNGWVRRLALHDSRAAITDLKFAPKYLGLQLVICTQNGEVRIYECNDIINSNVWNIVHPDLKTYMSSLSSCSWSTCFNLPILLALGSDESNPTSDKLIIFEHNENTRQYSRIEKNQSQICTDPIRSLAFAPSVGKLFHTLAIASKSLLVSTIKPIPREPHKYQITTESLENDASVWRVCWNTVGSVLASAGDDRKVKLWKNNYTGWRCFAEITGDSCSALTDQNLNLAGLLHVMRDSNQQQQQQGSQPHFQTQTSQTGLVYGRAK